MKEITPKELEEKINKGEELHLIDVREDDEVAAGMIPGAKHIPMNEIPAFMDKLDKSKEYIFICRSGNRSGRVCQFLEGHDYDVVNMVGGMLEWDGEVVTKN